jgi:hypothetical protein
VTVEKQ